MRCHQVLIFSLPLTIGGAVIATPVASPPIAALRMPAIYAPPPPPKADHQWRTIRPPSTYCSIH